MWLVQCPSVYNYCSMSMVMVRRNKEETVRERGDTWKKYQIDRDVMLRVIIIIPFSIKWASSFHRSKSILILERRVRAAREREREWERNIVGFFFWLLSVLVSQFVERKSMAQTPPPHVKCPCEREMAASGHIFCICLKVDTIKWTVNCISFILLWACE